MSYVDDRYCDEEGEPVMDLDMESDREFSPETVDEEDCRHQEPSHYPICNSEEYHHTIAKPKKNRLENKRGHGDLFLEPVEEKEYWCNEKSHSPAFDSGEDDNTRVRPIKIRLIKKIGHESSDKAEQSLKRKSEDGASGEARRKKKMMGDKGGRGKKSKSRSESVNKIRRLVNSGENFGNSKSNNNDTEVEEMWNTIAGDSEDDQAGQRTIEDDAFIDDTGVDPDSRMLSDENFIHNAPQAEEGEEDDEINSLFKSKKKKKKGFERSPEETAMLIEQFLAKFEVAAEEDAELNRQSKPAINKLKMLPLLTDALSKKQLQQEFLDRGILSVLKNWLEPLPDGCLPNINVRTAILKILTDLPVNIEQYDRRELLKKSGIGKSIMFLSKLDEEIPSNRKLAKELVDKWIRPIFQKSTRYEDMRAFDEERVPYRRPPRCNITEEKATALKFGDDGFDFLELPREPKPGEKGYRPHASRPEASPMDYVVRPKSKIDPEEIKARIKQLKQTERWGKLNKKLKNLKAPKKKRLQAAKISVEGRGLVKYF